MATLAVTPGPITVVELNRPEVRNALNDELVSELEAWASTVTTSSGIRAVILRGAGPVFCAGADIGWMARTAQFTDEENRADARRTARMLHALDRLPVAMIGRVHGAAIGGGIGLAAVCDIVIAAADARFAFTETTMGIVPAMIAPYVVRKIGVSAARALCLSGERFGAARACDIGLVHEVVPATDLDRVVQQCADQFGHAAPSAVAAAKRLLHDVAGHPPGDVLALTAEVIAAQRASEEGRDGLRAFLEKRAPAWDPDRPPPSIPSISPPRRGE
jgi:methylglutaconyl-CoA hydratase